MSKLSFIFSISSRQRFIHSVGPLFWSRINRQRSVTLKELNPSLQISDEPSQANALPLKTTQIKEPSVWPAQQGPSQSELECADAVFKQPVQFKYGVTEVDGLPKTEFPEVAFIGRSNVGKSTLINKLTNIKIAHSSSKPGRTKQLNFFSIGDKLMLVDMPGYGYKSRAHWGNQILTYFCDRKQLKRIFVLVDPLHGLKKSDQDIFHILDTNALSYQVILTKCDRVKKKEEFEAARLKIEQYLIKNSVCCYPELICVSAKNQEDSVGLVRWAILKACSFG